MTCRGGGGGHSCKFVHWSTPRLLGFRWGTCFEIKCPRGLYRGVSGIAYYKHHTVRARNKCKPHVHGNISRGPEQAKQLSVSSHLALIGTVYACIAALHSPAQVYIPKST